MKLYNTLSRTSETLKPRQDGVVSMYNCGLTVYSQPHIGNWVGYIYWDVLTRVLLASGLKVERIQNITDVGHLTSDDDDGEDKMEKGARSEGVTAWQVAEKYIAIANHEGYEILGLLKPTLIRATELIDEQIQFVKDLESKGYTYQIESDGIYLDTSKIPDYGKLARLDIDGLEAGARVPVEGKKNITDFALWKFSPKDKNRDMEWDSPWGKGFPGWHLECSVIARQHLGDQIDIHTGGVDHIPVHHTNEIAQTESLTGKVPFAQIWLHNNHLKINNSKMAKSEGNIYTLQDILDKGYDIDAFKLLVLSKHYRTEGNFTWEVLESYAHNLQNLRYWADLQYQNLSSAALQKNYQQIPRMLETLSDDLDTHAAIAYLNGLKNRTDELGTDSGVIAEACIEAEELLGLKLSRGDISEDQKLKLASRKQAREAKDWAKSDLLRDGLIKEGIGVNDTGNTQVWYRL